MIREVGPGADPAGLAARRRRTSLWWWATGRWARSPPLRVKRDLPLVSLPCGTLNHFAADAELDCNDPMSNVAAVENETELHVDVGTAGCS